MTLNPAMLTIDHRLTSADRAVLHLRGDFGLEAAAEVNAALTLLEVHAPRVLVVDLREVDIIDSSGLRVIVEADRRAKAAGRQLQVNALPGTVPRRLLELTLLTDLLSVTDDPDVRPAP